MSEIKPTTTYTNPRLHVEYTDWPIGGSNRGKCVFWVESKKGQCRIGRKTTNKHGEWCKPKYTIYGGPCAIVDGNDGRTYLLRHAGAFKFITVSRSDFYDHETVHADNPRLVELLALLAAVK